jgi:threonine synthase
MMGWQADGANPIVRGEPIANPQTVASAIRIGNPASWRHAEGARDESGGAIQSVSDEEILEAYHLLAQEEGIFCEPASAACVAGLLKTARSADAKDLAGKTVVCIITGHGLKDPDTALSVEGEVIEVPAEQSAVERAMGLA